MSIKALKCPNCSAPLPFAGGKAMVCRFCDHVLVDLPDLWWARAVDVPVWVGRPEDRGRPRVGLGRHTYVLREQIATGESSDVYLARRDARLTEQVVIKVARGGLDSDAARALRGEWRTLARLRGSGAGGADHFTRLLPRPVAHGALRADDRAPAIATAYGWRVGFRHTLATVRERYPSGVDPRVAVWMWKRILEMLTWLHSSGFVHGALRPEHCLVHPRAHGVLLVGWSRAHWRHGSSRSEPADDVAASAEVMARVLGGDVARLPSQVPSALRRLVLARSEGGHHDAWAVHEELVRVAAAVFGPPRYSPLSLDDG